MKKLLSILAAVGMTATAGIAVVACGTKDDNFFKGDDISKLVHQWDLNAYKENKSTDHGEITPSIWLNLKDITEDNKIKLSDKQWSQTIWTGMLNMDDKDGKDYKSTALSDFTDKKLWEVLHFTGNVNDVISKVLTDHKDEQLNEKSIIELTTDDANKLGMKSDVAIQSWTRSFEGETENPNNIKTDTPVGNIVKFGLEKSTLDKFTNLTIKFYKDDVQPPKNEQILDDYKTGKTVWVDTGITFDNNKVSKVDFNNDTSSLLLWTSMFDASDSFTALKHFSEQKINEVLHLTGEYNKILTGILEGRSKEELQQGIKFSSELIQSLGITLDKDVTQYQATGEKTLKAGEFKFTDLKVKMMGSNT